VHSFPYAGTFCRTPSVRRSLTFTSMRDPKRLRIDMSRSTVNLERFALRMREKSAAAMPVQPSAARSPTPGFSNQLDAQITANSVCRAR
jgi:hypothetical protein